MVQGGVDAFAGFGDGQADHVVVVDDPGRQRFSQFWRAVHEDLSNQFVVHLEQLGHGRVGHRQAQLRLERRTVAGSKPAELLGYAKAEDAAALEGGDGLGGITTAFVVRRGQRRDLGVDHNLERCQRAEFVVREWPRRDAGVEQPWEQ